MKKLILTFCLFPLLALAQSRVIISDDGTNAYWGTVTSPTTITNNSITVTTAGSLTVNGGAGPVSLTNGTSLIISNTSAGGGITNYPRWQALSAVITQALTAGATVILPLTNNLGGTMDLRGGTGFLVSSTKLYAVEGCITAMSGGTVFNSLQIGTATNGVIVESFVRNFGTIGSGSTTKLPFSSAITLFAGVTNQIWAISSTLYTNLPDLVEVGVKGQNRILLRELP
jgi:hypothetical protein